ncbi:MAG: RidA family protein, partial [Nitrospirae bacterium]
VLNAASELLNRVFGEGHTRVAIGVPVLPMNSPLEMDFILSLKK